MQIYYEGFVDPNFISEMALTVHTAFPSLETSFSNLLFAYLVQQQFSPFRIFKSIEYVVQTCVYPNPTIANFYQPFNFNLKLFEFNELYNTLWGEYKHDWQSYFQTEYQKIKINDQEYFVKIEEVANIKPFLEPSIFKNVFGGEYVL